MTDHRQPIGDQWVVLYRPNPLAPIQAYDAVYSEAEQREAIKACMDRHTGCIAWAQDALKTEYPDPDDFVDPLLGASWPPDA